MTEASFSQQVTVTSPNGLHLRPLEMLVTCGRQFESRIEFIKDNERIDGKSMMECLGLISGQGTRLTITTYGPDAESALAMLVGLFESQFERPPEDRTPPPSPLP